MLPVFANKKSRRFPPAAALKVSKKCPQEQQTRGQTSKPLSESKGFLQEGPRAASVRFRDIESHERDMAIAFRFHHTR